MKRLLSIRWLPWVLFTLSAALGCFFLFTTFVLAASKGVPVPGPTVTAVGAPRPAVTVTATPAPARTVTVTDTARVDYLTAQLQACDEAWREVASDEQKALVAYSDATQSLVRGIQQGDSTLIDVATGRIQDAGNIVDAVTPKVTTAHATCGADQ